MANLENWLSPFLTGIRHWRDVNSALLDAAFRSRYSRAQLAEVDALAPEIWESPIGNRIELLYKENDVELPVKLQELFGVAQTPAVMKGAVPVLLHLLSPARRPVQVTRDLSSFWNHAYHEVRKELRGRYPKHSWPEDPWSAQPVRK